MRMGIEVQTGNLSSCMRASGRSRTTPRYSAAFRRDVVRLLRTGCSSMCEMTAATGLSRNTLNRWVRESSDGA